MAESSAACHLHAEWTSARFQRLEIVLKILGSMAPPPSARQVWGPQKLLLEMERISGTGGETESYYDARRTDRTIESICESF